jgi:hypothetical protein
MRFQTSLERTTSGGRTITIKRRGYWENVTKRDMEHYMHASQRQSNDEFAGMHGMMDDRQETYTPTPRIPRAEQDEDRWRFERPMPGRDPVTAEKGI